MRNIFYARIFFAVSDYAYVHVAMHTERVMPLEKSLAAQESRAAYTIDEFCEAHRISRSKLYHLWNERRGPRMMRIGTKVLITAEAAADWRREREAESHPT